LLGNSLAAKNEDNEHLALNLSFQIRAEQVNDPANFSQNLAAY
jgi:hypothetical protein